MKDKILQVLREADDFISGQEICNRFSVSRTAVWKAIKQLRDEGYSIEAVNNKGYRLEETPDVISALELGSLLHTQWFGKEILYFDSIDSTNNELKRQATACGCGGTDSRQGTKRACVGIASRNRYMVLVFIKTGNITG